MLNPSNVIQGPAILYWAPFGTAEPTDASVTPEGYLQIPPAPWADVGGTSGGVSLKVNQTITDQTVDQVVDPIGGRLTKRAVQVTTTLAEATMANWNLILNQIMSIGSGTGYQTMDVQQTTSATQPTYVSLMLYGWAPLLSTGAPALRRVIVRKCLANGEADLTYTLDKQVGYQSTWNGYYVSPSVSPYHVAEETQ